VHALGCVTPFGTAFGAVLRSQIALASGQRTRAIELARVGLEHFRHMGAATQEAATQLLLARLVGGEEGRLLSSAAARYFAREGMQRPDFLVATTVPFAVHERFASQS
jgi:hypothetical protein